LTSPGYDRILFWDESVGEIRWLQAGTNLTVDDTVLNASAGAGGYVTIQEEEVSLTQRSTMNFIGVAITASDDPGNARTNITLSQSPSDSSAIVGTTRDITTTSPLTGGGNLSADRTFGLAGLTGLGTANQVLGMNNAANAYEYKTLSTDSGISISHSTNSILISGPGQGPFASDSPQFVVVVGDPILPNERILTGTSNQVIVTDSGAGASITLSTPQSIHTSATPQFAKIGLGIAADSTAQINLASAGQIRVAGVDPFRSIILSAAGGWPTTTGGCASPAKVESTTNKQNYYVLDFDQSTDENAEWTLVMPDSYDGGTITAIFYWTAATGSGNVIWAIKGRSYADDEAIDQAYGTAVGVTDGLITTGDVHVSSATSAVTLAGTPAGGELIQIRIYRKASDTGDTLNADARLIAVKIEYKVSVYSD